MKSILTGFAFIILFTGFHLFQVDQDCFIRAQEEVKVLCDDISAAGVLFFEEDAFSNGKKIYNQTQAENVISTLIQKNMKLEPNLHPSPGTYWEEPVEYWTYYIDESGFITTRKNGLLVSRVAFVMGSVFTEPQTQYMKLISEPTLIATIKTKYPSGIGRGSTWPEIVRSSAYENLDRN